jgi:hypothetical protein
MVRVASFAFVALADGIYTPNFGYHCHEGHGGTPVDADDTPLSNITEYDCESACDNNTKCFAFEMNSTSGGGRRRRKAMPDYSGDCYLRSDVHLSQCEKSHSSMDRTWTTYTQVDQPPLTGLRSYHLFERKYTGLGNKDAGDFKGDAGFIFFTFSSGMSKGNPEASLENNIIEMSEVNVTGWGRYEQCNAPGANGHFACPANQTDYCCTVHGKGHDNIPTNHTKDQLPGLEISPHSPGSAQLAGGFWFSFPKESEGTTWTEKLLRRIEGKCLGNAWRKDAGGCNQCGESLDSCVATCIQTNLGQNDTLLQTTWDRVFADPNECPEVPLPGQSTTSTTSITSTIVV